ncbi:MAG: YbjN domain-containing protein [Desulfovibrio sp.]|nr:YbjN domain-containing protein [Desulfovibrio sp.]
MKKLCGIAWIGLAIFLAWLGGEKTVQAAELLGEGSFSEIVSIAQQFGSADLIREEGQEPRFDGKINGILYAGLFRDCNEDQSRCGSLTLRALYEVEQMNVEKVNAFNTDTKSGKLYLAENKLLVFDYFFPLQGGLSQENLQASFEWFILGLQDIAKILDSSPHQSRSLLDKANELLR